MTAAAPEGHPGSVCQTLMAQPACEFASVRDAPCDMHSSMMVTLQ